MSDVKVTARLKENSQPTQQQLFETITTDDGTFVINNLPPGVYIVFVTTNLSELQPEKTVRVSKGKRVKVNLEVGRACDQIEGDLGTVSAEDKAEVVKSALMQFISPKWGMLTNKQEQEGMILSTKNIRPEWVKDFKGIKLKLMSERQVQQKADREGDFEYLLFPELKVRGTCIAVTVALWWARAKNSQFIYLSGGSSTFEYRKKNGQWVSKYVIGGVS